MIKLLVLAAALLPTATIDKDSAASLVDSKAIIEGILSKGSPSSAWGAYYAGKFGLEECVPALLELVERENRRVPTPVPIVKKAALDALIRIGADVPTALLSAGLHKDYLAETMILLARDPVRNHDALLDLMDHGSVERQHWWAAAAILAPLEPRGLAKRLLPEIRFNVSVSVRDPGSEQTSNYFEGYGSGGRWGSTGTLFPPKPTYVFSNTAVNGAVVLQAKPILLYYRRTEGARGGISAPKAGPMTRSRFALRFVLEMIGGERPDLPRKSELSWIVTWVDEQDFRQQIDLKTRRLRSSFERLVETLCARNLLAPGECEELEPDIKIKVFDLREDKTPSLPELPSKG